ncbi:ubiquitin-conjugating enzyme [Rhexocercosporidium sp. MPI-PUGE-AT-0058]|nr:ubiquitin-conjugating enzyme [Rhexocercosporidium sp. MPI-PUGE-AT-0058]
MASRAANNRLTREYQTLSTNPTPFISAHPSEANILEWHYILTGPPDTPYHNGQYWAWSVSTILIGLLSFMTSEEMTTGSVGGTDAERRWAAQHSRWWNSTGGGSHKDITGKTSQKGNIKAGDGGAKFAAEWPEVDAENWKWMKETKVDIMTGNPARDPSASTSTNCGPGIGGLKRPRGSQPVVGAVVEGGRVVGEEGKSWIRRNKLLVVGGLIFTYVLIARLLGEGPGT